MNRYEEREPIVLMNEGQKIFGVIHRPLTEKKTPAVTICHGLAGNKTGRYRLYVVLAKHLVQAGFTVLRLDYRGSGDSEGDFLDMTLDTAVSDAVKGLEFIANDSSVDASRIGIAGRSFGGAVALKAANRFRSVKSIALWAPMFSGEQWMDLFAEALHEKTDNQRREELMRINGQTMGSAFLQQFFNMSLDDDIKAIEKIPLLHIHGEMDSVVVIAHADRYYNFRKNAEGETRFFRLPGADHDFSRSEDQRKAIAETTEWFLRTL